MWYIYHTDGLELDFPQNPRHGGERVYVLDFLILCRFISTLLLVSFLYDNRNCFKLSTSFENKYTENRNGQGT